MEKDQVGSDAAVDSQEEGSSSPNEQQPLQRQKKTRKSGKKTMQKEKKSSSQLPGLDNLPTDSVTNTAQGAVSGVTNTLGSVANNTMDNAQGGQESGGGSKSDTLRLRLDLNLEIEIQLKARIHGDLELALL